MLSGGVAVHGPPFLPAQEDAATHKSGDERINKGGLKSEIAWRHTLLI